MKTIRPEDLDCHTEWICPYAKCRHFNVEHSEPDWLEEVTCTKCKRKMKIKSYED